MAFKVMPFSNKPSKETILKGDYFRMVKCDYFIEEMNIVAGYPDLRLRKWFDYALCSGKDIAKFGWGGVRAAGPYPRTPSPNPLIA